MPLVLVLMLLLVLLVLLIYCRRYLLQPREGPADGQTTTPGRMLPTGPLVEGEKIALVSETDSVIMRVSRGRTIAALFLL